MVANGEYGKSAVFPGPAAGPVAASQPADKAGRAAYFAPAGFDGFRTARPRRGGPPWPGSTGATG